ncbi:MAG TPA: hypothetical protein VM031_04915 [Phycisphaerae bacterium]|nr:hypothetical protein [Phycisphaerae bacterium]
MSNESQRILRHLSGWGPLVILCGSVVATGQVQRLETGQVLDANPRVGSFGANRPSAQPAFNSQLYVTGQVGGLRRFHGTVGYFGGDQLHLGLPSASLGGFRRQSVGLEDVLRGRLYEPTPYYERTTTAMRADDILAGRTAPGTNVPAVAIPVASPIGQKLYVDAMADFYSVAAEAPGRALAPPRPASLIPSLISPTVRGTTAGSAAAPFSPAYPAEATSLFSVPRSTDQAELAGELYQQARNRRLLDRKVDGRVEAGTDGRQRRGGERSGTAGTREAGDPIRQDQTRGGAVGRAPGGGVPDQDVFMDLMMLGQRQRMQRRQKGTAAAATTKSATAPASPGSVGAWQGSLVKVDPAGQIVIHGLAGRSNDPFNMRMAQARETLRARRYYDAAGLYESAGRTTPHNPLARIGKGLSLLGAGEPLSAAYQLRRAISLFPPMMKGRIDLASVIDAKVVEMQLADVEARLRNADDEAKKMLQFLAMFLYYNSRHEDKARSFAEKVRASARDASLLRSYAELILRASPDEKRGRSSKPGGKPTGDKPGRLSP